MERHPYPFACTTNAPEILDPATARRFLFNVRFLPMSAQQIAAAFRQSFGLECPEFVAKLTCLMPGDFAVVARKAEALGESDPRQLARWLDEEAAAKPQGSACGLGSRCLVPASDGAGRV
jgi:transitional endoplasmic reticulum ATPase